MLASTDIRIASEENAKFKFALLSQGWLGAGPGATLLTKQLRYADAMRFPIIPCTLCGSQEHLQRKQVTAMLRDWEKRHPGRLDSIFSALATVAPSHLLDRALFDFAGVRATGRPVAGGDTAFDADASLEDAIERALLHPGGAIPIGKGG